jgi:hypothetical protein
MSTTENVAPQVDIRLLMLNPMDEPEEGPVMEGGRFVCICIYSRMEPE